MKNKKRNNIITYSLIIIVAIISCICITNNKVTEVKDQVPVYYAPNDLVTIKFEDQNLYKKIKSYNADGFNLSSLIQSYDDTNMTVTLTDENVKSVNRLYLASYGINNISGIEKFTSLRILYLNNNPISDISALSSLINLTNLHLNDNPISDISALSSLTNLTSLSLDNNQISDIAPLNNLTNLTSLNLNNNKISDVSALSSLTNLTYLYIYSNKVSDISALSNLTNLAYLSLYNNQISDITPLTGLSIFESNNIAFYGNKSIGTVSKKEYKIPSIIMLREKDDWTNSYSPKELTLINCTLSDDGTSVILNPGLKKGDNVIIKVEDSVTDFGGGIPVPGITHTLTVDDVYIDPPIPTITYSKTEKTNESVTATISFNKEGVIILNNDGKNTCTFDSNGEFTFEYIDENGNRASAKAVVKNIDKEMPSGNVTYETTDEGVVATITFNKEGITILNNDGKNTYTFKENGEFTFEFVDMFGNKGTATAKVSNITKTVDNQNNDSNINNENVNTGDIVVYFVIALVMSVVCISITTIYKTKNKNIL